MKIPFTKMHGAGNDYIYINCMEGEYFDSEYIARIMSPRHTAVGADGIVLIYSSKIADAKMRMFNADGSEGAMCGNALRCIGKYLYDNGIVKKKEISVETPSGVRRLVLSVNDGRVYSVCIHMGRASFEPGAIPTRFRREMINEPLCVSGGKYYCTAVSIGNPHAVIFQDGISRLPIEEVGSEIENHSLFPERVNVEFVKVLSSSHIQMRVWERGSGETLACGTGACAAVAASVKLGICTAGEEITVSLPGGDLKIVCSPDFEITMSGPAVKVYDGVLDTDDLRHKHYKINQ